MSYKPLLFLMLCEVIGSLSVSLPTIFIFVKPTTTPIAAMIIGAGSSLIGIAIGGIVAIVYADRSI